MTGPDPVDDGPIAPRPTLPGWDGPVTALPRARAWLVFSTGCTGPGCAVPTWSAQGHEVVDVDRPDQDAAAADPIALLQEASLGTRVAVCGTESAIGRWVAAALDAGFLGDEIVAHAHGPDRPTLYCPACGTLNPQEPNRCTGCGSGLVPHRHFAVRRGAYLATPEQ